MIMFGETLRLPHGTNQLQRIQVYPQGRFLWGKQYIKKKKKNNKLNSTESVHEDEITASGELYPISKQAKNKPSDSKGPENI